MSTTSSATATQVLFDAPGPKGRRRILLLSILSVAAILAVLAGALWQFHANGQLDPGKWVVYLRADYIAFLGQGLWGTLKVTALAAVVAFPFGLLLALARLSRFTLLKAVAVTWIEFFRGIPMLLVVYAFLLALPAFGVTFPRFWMLVIPMILVSSASTAEVFRAGINAVDKGQHEAAAAIGLGRRDALVHVVLPQAVRLVLPSLILALVSLLKDSTLGYVVSFNELQFQGKTLVSITRYLVQTYLVVSAIYIVINLVLTRIALALDARMKARAAAS
ncbi:amino acid ABC transporter permease [Brachybacterium saurashtrense]|uniref:Amino acid ABC transporter permease n=1 Tax=Brachybacterium saurashtrense TaxID=556288 RepID=A0A345YR45_9MICO|nr:amino acid ABC transporter permease [Brachybacterium saurashtrense]AXK46397.1 amino acid ABC transporter permease [Brachybacterium saurashtrense]RRR24138.1 amino acid ABC transporter permease [Brachybacterium saurashtrense]